MSDTGEWVTVDPESFDNPSTEHHQDVEINVFFSPYDLPRQVRGGYDDKANRFRIEFRYLVPERPTSKETIDDHVTFYLGKNDRRLLVIEVDTEKLGAKEVVLNLLAGAIDGLTERHAEYSDNYEVALEIVDDLSDEIFVTAT